MNLNTLIMAEVHGNARGCMEGFVQLRIFARHHTAAGIFEQEAWTLSIITLTKGHF